MTRHRMRPPTRRVALGSAFGAACALVAALAGWLPPTSAWAWQEAEPPAITADDIQKRIDAVSSDAQLEENARNELLGIYRQALQDLNDRATRQTVLDGFRRQAETAPADLKSVTGRLADFESEIRARLAAQEAAREALASLESKLAKDGEQLSAARQKLEEFKQTLTSKEDQLKTAIEDIAKWDAEPKRRAARLETMQASEQEIKRNLEAARQQETEFSNDTTPLGRAKYAGAVARKLSLERQLELMEAERIAYEKTTGLVQSQRDLAASIAKTASEDEKAWTQIVNQLRQAVTAREAADARRAVLEASPELKELTTEVESLTEERQELARKIKEATTRLAGSRESLAQVSTNFQRAQDRVEASGLSQASGELLRKQRTELPDLPEYLEATAVRRDEMGEMRFNEYKHQDQSLMLATLDDQLDEYPENLREEARSQLAKKKEAIDGLIKDYKTYNDLLLQLNDVERQLIDEVQEFSHFIDERVLWIRSAFPWSRRDLEPAKDGLMWLTSDENWLDFSTVLYLDAEENIWYYAPVALAFLLMLYFGRQVRRTISMLGDTVSRRGYYQFGPTLRTLALTIVLSLPGAALIWIIGWRLSSLFNTSPFVRAVSQTLCEVAWATAALAVLRHVCRSKGLAISHLQWPQGAVTTLRSMARSAQWYGVPLAAVILILEHQKVNSLWSGSLGRMFFALLMAATSLAVDRMVRSQKGLLHQVMAYAPSTSLYRTRYFWAPALIGTPLVLAIMCWWGYYQTVLVLSARLFDTICLILGLWLTHDVLARGVLMRRRRLTIEKIRERRRLAELAASDETESRGIEGAPAQDMVEEVDLASVSQQSVKMLQVLILLLGIVGGWVIWHDVVPAFSMLEDYPLWPGGLFSIADLIYVSLIILVTIAAFRNIPGILELTLLAYLPVDAGARYATTTVVRYLIAGLGIASAAYASGFTPENLQWLIATMGIGLGFGLQEIFANFVSGLILLFERPIRVGDIITLDTTTGMVTRIRLRATTITDWDRKEYIVPNKDLITGRLLNWTLTDQTNRIVIPVGVAYGSDTELARQLLLDVANQHPLILDDPTPMATFESFGDSALNLILRCYLPNLDNRLATIHELHTAIHKTFREHGIEIAFPQLDVHLKRG